MRFTCQLQQVNITERKKKKQKEDLVIWYIMPFHKKISAKIF